MSAKKEVKFKNGCMWEGGPWSIKNNVECSEWGSNKDGDCKHCHSKKTKTHSRTDGSTFIEQVWICPRVVVANNEGGFNSTGVCLDCILEGASGLSQNCYIQDP